MAGIQHILRKAALEKMASPEQLDMAMRVTSPAGWIALAALAALIVSAVAMSIVAQVPVKVDASGILLRGELQTVEATANGILDKVTVAEGDTVQAGMVVAMIRIPEVESEIQATESRIKDLQDQVNNRATQTAALLGSYEQQLANLNRRRANVERLVAQKIKTRNDLADIDAQISGVRAQMVQARDVDNQLRNQLADEGRKREQLGRKRNGAEVVSKHSGRVAAVLKRQGQVVQQKERLLNLEDPDADFQVLLFVPFAEGKKVKPKQVVRISPTTVHPEEHGYILGKIESVSSLPVTPEEVRTALNNDQLAERFAQETPFKVTARPLLAPGSNERFIWTSSGGTPPLVGANTPCLAQIVIDQRRPISYVIPALKRASGVGN